MQNYHYILEISDSEMEAYLTIEPVDREESLSDQDFPSIEEVIRYLETSGIQYGINHKAIERLVKYRKLGETIQVARGEKPSAGEKGSIEYYFDVSQQNNVPVQSADPFTCSQSHQFVHTGDLLAKRLPPQKGSPGITVTGKKIASGKGSEVYLRTGRNSFFSDDDERELRAAIDGIATLQGGAVHVDGTKLFDGDVDSSAGQIHFPGNIIVLRNVLDGCRLQAGGNIEICGDVGDAELDAAGNVKVKGEFRGSGRGVIKAGGDAFLKIVEHQTVNAKGSLYIRDYVRDATLIAGESISLIYFDGEAVGGRMQAGWNIIANKLGNKKDPITVEIQSDDDPFDDLKRWLSALDEAQEKLEDVDIRIQVLTSKINEEGRDTESIGKTRSLRRRRRELDKTISELQEKIDRLREKQKRLGEYRVIQVRSRISAGTKVIIGEAEKILTKTHRASKFREIGGIIDHQIAESGVLI